MRAGGFVGSTYKLVEWAGTVSISGLYPYHFPLRLTVQNCRPATCKSSVRSKSSVLYSGGNLIRYAFRCCLKSRIAVVSSCPVT